MNNNTYNNRFIYAYLSRKDLGFSSAWYIGKQDRHSENFYRGAEHLLENPLFLKAKYLLICPIYILDDIDYMEKYLIQKYHHNLINVKYNPRYDGTPKNEWLCNKYKDKVIEEKLDKYLLDIENLKASDFYSFSINNRIKTIKDLDDRFIKAKYLDKLDWPPNEDLYKYYLRYQDEAVFGRRVLNGDITQEFVDCYFISSHSYKASNKSDDINKLYISLSHNDEYSKETYLIGTSKFITKSIHKICYLKNINGDVNDEKDVNTIYVNETGCILDSNTLEGSVIDKEIFYDFFGALKIEYDVRFSLTSNNNKDYSLKLPTLLNKFMSYVSACVHEIEKMDQNITNIIKPLCFIKYNYIYSIDKCLDCKNPEILYYIGVLYNLFNSLLFIEVKQLINKDLLLNPLNAWDLNNFNEANHKETINELQKFQDEIDENLNKWPEVLSTINNNSYILNFSLFNATVDVPRVIYLRHNQESFINIHKYMEYKSKIDPNIAFKEFSF